MGRTEYKNQHIKDHYDRINLIVPKGQKDIIKCVASDLGLSVNEYLNLLIRDDLATNRIKSKKQGVTEEHQRILEKWQVARKYYSMIEDLSYSKEDGYFVYLKEGFVNDVTGSRSIQCEKTSELRRIIVKSHKK